MRAMNLVGPSQMIMHPDRVEAERLGFLSDLSIDCGDASGPELGRRTPKLILFRLLMIGRSCGIKKYYEDSESCNQANDLNWSNDDR